MTAAIRPTVATPYARIVGVGTYRPERVVTNAKHWRRGLAVTFRVPPRLRDAEERTSWRKL